MVYDDTTKKWIPSGSSGTQGVSKVQIFHHYSLNTFRVVGRKLQDHEVGLKFLTVSNEFGQMSCFRSSSIAQSQEGWNIIKLLPHSINGETNGKCTVWILYQATTPVRSPIRCSGRSRWWRRRWLTLDHRRHRIRRVRAKFLLDSFRERVGFRL